MSNLTFSDVRGVLNDLNEKLAGEKANETLDGLKKFLRGENPFETTTAKWEERDNVIYFTLPATDGRTGKQWKKSLESQGKRLSDAAKAILDSNDFVSTTGVVYKVAAIRGTFWKDAKRMTKNIEAEGTSRGWLKLQPETVCLVREYFSDDDLEKMGLWYIVGIHEPIGVLGHPLFLYAYRFGDGCWLSTGWANPDFYWGDRGAFAWSLPQVQS